MANTSESRCPAFAALLLPVAALGLASSWVEAVLPLYAADAGTLTPFGARVLFTWGDIVGLVFQLPTAGLAGFTVATASGLILAMPLVPLLIVGSATLARAPSADSTAPAVSRSRWRRMMPRRLGLNPWRHGETVRHWMKATHPEVRAGREHPRHEHGLTL